MNLFRLFSWLIVWVAAVSHFQNTAWSDESGSLVGVDTPHVGFLFANPGEEQSMLRRSTSPSWYSVDSGTLKTAPISGRRLLDVEDRHSKIESPRVTQTPVSSSRSTSSAGGWLSDLFYFFYSVWGAIAITLLIALLGLAVFVLSRGKLVRGYKQGKKPAHDLGSRDRQKITDLPFDVQQSTVGFLERADQLRQQGDVSKAIIYLFSHLLVELDAAAKIRLERGKTNRAYLRELRQDKYLRNFTGGVVKWFEFVFFGKHEMDVNAYDQLRSQMDQVEGHIRRTDAAEKQSRLSRLETT